MYYEKILNQEPNETVSQGIITEASPLVCGQSVPLLLNSFTNTSKRYQLVLQVLLSQGTKVYPSQHSRECIGKGHYNSIKISFPTQVMLQPFFLLLAQGRGKREKQRSFLEQEFCSKHPWHHYLTFPESQSSSWREFIKLLERSQTFA